mmetsp:Transcript_12519/g.28892  ORF Transcript_12519/g.28892 Transcript_12519/m.28892 type:complete len:296 (-) Transcript_12519:6-893(-)
MPDPCVRTHCITHAYACGLAHFAAFPFFDTFVGVSFSAGAAPGLAARLASSSKHAMRSVDVLPASDRAETSWSLPAASAAASSSDHSMPLRSPRCPRWWSASALWALARLCCASCSCFLVRSWLVLSSSSSALAVARLFLTSASACLSCMELSIIAAFAVCCEALTWCMACSCLCKPATSSLVFCISRTRRSTRIVSCSRSRLSASAPICCTSRVFFCSLAASSSAVSCSWASAQALSSLSTEMRCSRTRSSAERAVLTSTATIETMWFQILPRSTPLSMQLAEICRTSSWTAIE